MAQTILIFSGKGGTGKSSVTVGLGRALAAMDKRVLLVDCDIGLRCLDLLLGAAQDVVFDWGDLLLDRCSAADAILPGEVDLLAAPRRYDPSFDAAGFAAMLQMLQANYDYILLDAPAGIGTGLLLAAAGADSAVGVTTPDAVCVRSCCAAYSALRAQGLTDARLIINLFEVRPVLHGRLLNVDQCIDETGIRLLGAVPRDPAVSFCSVTGKAPDEFSPASLAYERIARRLCGEKVPLVCD
ncbi:MAG: P-loop NTPase [Clostridia bacterium]|nr:P-loop NTPase [Clostridia bacterium]